MAFVDWEGGAWRSLCQSGQEPGGSWEHRCPLPPTRPGVPSMPALLPGLPDEAFESLTRLQHIYVAHNKVSSHQPPTPPTPARSHSTECRGDSMGLEGATRTSAVCSCSSRWPPSFCLVPSE